MEEVVKGERHPNAHPKGGFCLQDPDNLIPSATKDLMKKIGGKLLKLQIFDLMKISSPAKIAYPITYLECFLNDYTYFPRFMKDVCDTKDNIERVKLITTWIIAGLHVGESTLQAYTPLNPVLGETCQRYAPDGTKYYAEQITHHPPVSAAVMEGPDEKWRFEVIQEFKATLNGHNSIKAHKEGAMVLTLSDGTQYVVEEGHVNIDGLVYGKLVVNIWGTITITDITNNIRAEWVFDPEKKGMVKKLASKLKFWGKKQEKRPSDHFDIRVFQTINDEEEVICEGTGSYLEFLEFDGERYWEMGEEWGEWHKPEEILHSDSSFRKDLLFLKDKDYDAAQTAKEEIENAQRADKALRDKGKK